MKPYCRWLFLGLSLLVTVSASLATEQNRTKRVLIIGASNSIAYTTYVREMLRDEAIVFRPNQNGKPENCQGTSYGVRNIDRWLKIDGGNFDTPPGAMNPQAPGAPTLLPAAATTSAHAGIVAAASA